MKNEPDHSCPVGQGFRDEAHLQDFVNANCPGVHIVRQWRCSECNQIHYEGSFVRTAKQAEQAAVKSGLAQLKELGDSL